MTYTTSTTDSGATQRLGQKIGRQLRGGTMIELVGDIGSGKTTLAQGIAAGLGFDGEVSSPTFTISRLYPIRDGMQLHHFDWYRLRGPDPITAEFAEAVADPAAIVVVEWAGNTKAQLPAGRLRIILTPDAKQASSRTITLESLGQASDYLVQRLAA